MWKLLMERNVPREGIISISFGPAAADSGEVHVKRLTRVTVGNLVPG